MNTPNQPEQPSTEVAAPTGGALAVPEFYEGTMDEGFENASSKTYAIPFLQILQKMSPQVDSDDPKYVKGAIAGMFFNNVTQELFDGKEGLKIIQCYYRESFIHWQHRNNGGGFKGQVTPEAMDKIIEKDEVVNVNGKWLIKDQNGAVDPDKSDYYMDTRSHYILILNPKTGALDQAVLSLAATQIKASMSLMTRLRQRIVQTASGKRSLPTYANIVQLGTTPQSNEKGSWTGAKFTIEPEPIKDKELFETARAFRNAIHAGEVKEDYSKSQDSESSEGVSTTPQEAKGF